MGGFGGGSSEGNYEGGYLGRVSERDGEEEIFQKEGGGGVGKIGGRRGRLSLGWGKNVFFHCQFFLR